MTALLDMMIVWSNDSHALVAVAACVPAHIFARTSLSLCLNNFSSPKLFSSLRLTKHPFNGCSCRRHHTYHALPSVE